MKKIIIIISVVVLLIGLDIGSILLRDKPLFAISNNDDSSDVIYKGLLYNTYNCIENSDSLIKMKWVKYECPRAVLVSDITIYGIITEINDNYLVVKGTKDSNNLKIDNEAHISLDNNPTIVGANNLIIGQTIEVIPTYIEEVYPIRVVTNKIIVNSSN